MIDDQRIAKVISVIKEQGLNKDEMIVMIHYLKDEIEEMDYQKKLEQGS